MASWYARLLVFAQSLDILTFLIVLMFVPVGSFEQNPIIMSASHVGGLPLVLLMKVAMTSTVAAMVAMNLYARAVGSMGIAVGVVGAGFNTFSLLQVMT